MVGNFRSIGNYRELQARGKETMIDNNALTIFAALFVLNGIIAGIFLYATRKRKPKQVTTKHTQVWYQPIPGTTEKIKHFLVETTTEVL